MRIDTKQGLSPFGEFIYDTVGMNFSKNGKQLDKWEVFELGYRDILAIASGKTPIKITYQR